MILHLKQATTGLHSEIMTSDLSKSDRGIENCNSKRNRLPRIAHECIKFVEKLRWSITDERQRTNLIFSLTP